MGNTYLPKAFFISLVVNMENLIGNMMIWENVTEQKLMRWRLRLKKLLDTLTGGGNAILLAYVNKKIKDLDNCRKSCPLSRRL